MVMNDKWKSMEWELIYFYLFILRYNGKGWWNNLVFFKEKY